MKKEILPSLIITMLVIIFLGKIQAQPLSVSITSINLTCYGDNTGSATATPTGGTPPYSYLWSTGHTTATINNLTVGTYVVTVTDQNSSVATASVTIMELEPIELISETMNLSCYGANDGSINVTASNGEPPYSFFWSNGSTDSYLDNLPAGSYDVTVTDDIGCKSFADHVLTQPLELIINLVDLNHEICSGTENGSIAIGVYGGDSPYSILWSNGSPGLTLNNLAPDTYTVTVTDDNDCSETATYIINPGNAVEIELLQIQHVDCYGNSTGAISILASEGNAPYTYSWSYGYTGPAIDNLPSDVYFVTVHDEDNCTATADYEVTQPTEIVIELEELQSETCYGEDDGYITIQIMGGENPYAVHWSNGMEELSIQDLAPGVYAVTATDDTGCMKTEAYEIYSGNVIQANLLEAQNISCHGGSNGSLSLSASGGNAPYTYLWSNGMAGSSISGLTAGTYTATITDAYGCAGSDGYTLSEPMPISISIVQTSQNPCFGDTLADLNATVTGGIPSYAALWSDGYAGLQNSNLQAGTYTISITDANACLANQSVTITDPVLLTTTTTSTNETAFGANDGTAMSNPTGGVPPFSFLWNNGDTLSALSGLSPGTYMVTITDANDCTSEGTAIVNAFGCSLDIMPGADLNICEDDTITIQPIVMGGSGYSYLWSDGSTGESLSVYQTGEYCVTVSDEANCQDLDCVVITEIIIPPFTCPATDESGPGANDGSVQCDSLPGIISYLWSNGETTPSIDSLSPGQYCVTVTEQNGCLDTQCFYVQPGNCQMSVDSVITDVSCAGDTTGSISMIVDNGAAPIIYEWSNGDTTAVIENLSAGIYSVTVSDAYGCVSLNEFVISEPLPLTASVENVAPADTTGSGHIWITVAGGTPAYTYQWSDPSGDTIDTKDLNNLSQSGYYTLILTDSLGCVFILDSVYVDQKVAVDLTPAFESLKVYPIPAKDVLIIDTDKLISEVWISGVDGRVYKRIIRPGSNQLDIADLGPGWYILRIRMGNMWYVARVVK